MGKFLDEKAIIHRNIENYNNYINETGLYIEGNPTFTTYYSKNNKASTEDVGLGNVVELVGTESPIKYNRIENFPLYGMTEMNLNYDFDEDSSIGTVLDGSAVILANTIKPLTDDYFTIYTIANKDILFRITNVEGSHIGSKFFYKVDFVLSRDKPELLEENQLEELLSFEYDNLGSQNSPLIQSDLHKRLKDIEQIMYLLRESYIERYFNKVMNAFFFDSHIDDNIHYLFHIHKELLLMNKSYLSDLKIEPVVNKFSNLFRENYYNHTPYHFIEEMINPNRNIDDIFSEIWYNDTMCRSLASKGSGVSIFSRSHTTYYEYTWYKSNDCEMSEYWSKFYENVLLERYDNNLLSDIILHYINDKIILETKIDNILTLIKKNEKQLNRYNLEMYILIPCLLLILQALKNNIINQTNLNY